MLKGAVEGAFCIGVKKACRQLSFLQMIKDAVAADSLAAAGVVGAVAPLEVVFYFTFHRLSRWRLCSACLFPPRRNDAPVSW